MLGAVRFVTALRPLGIVTAEQFDKLELGGESPLTMRTRCSAFRYCPNPLGIVTVEQFDKLEFVGLMLLHIFEEFFCFGPIFYSPVFKIPLIHI